MSKQRLGYAPQRMMTTVRVTVVTADRKESPAYRARLCGTQETFLKYGDPGVPQKGRLAP